MKHVLVAALFALGLSTAAYAQDDQMKGSQTRDPQTKDMQTQNQNVGSQDTQTGETKDISGKVIGFHSANRTIYLDQDGAALPIRITENTMIDGAKMSKGKIETMMKKQMQEGQEVRASFELRHDKSGRVENVAKSIDVNNK